MTAGPGVRIALRVAADGTFEAARFETCAFEAARPVADAVCRRLVGARIEAAAAMTEAEVAALGGVPPGSPAARTTHYAKSAALRPFVGPLSRGSGITCTCFGIGAATIRDAIRRHGVRTVEELQRLLPVCTGCGTCRPDVRALLEEPRPGR